MRLEPDQFWTFNEWLLEHRGLLDGFLLALVLIVLGFVISYIVAMVRYGPGEGFYVVAKNMRDLFRTDLPNTSFRRIGAIAKLAFMEAIRRKVLAVVAIFVVAMMFAGWYLDPQSENPARLYISFVLASTNYLVLLLGLYLSTFSLPADIKNKTIYTIVTKPVRATEILLGRIFGFALIGTAILSVLGVLSYIFVTRGLDHTHQIERVASADRAGETTSDDYHRHSYSLNEKTGEGVTNVVKGHRHLVTVDQSSGEKNYIVGAPEGALTARVPVYGVLNFTDRDGKQGTNLESSKGLNVGFISEYQRYIAGASLMSAIWTFNGVTQERFGDFLQMEMTLAAFRTITGDIVTPVRGTIILRSTDGTVESDRRSFLVKEFELDEQIFPRKLQGFVNSEPREIDLYDDIAKDGSMEIIIRCEDFSQFLGMAQADVSLRAADGSFIFNFFKGYVSIWLQMVIIISFGVMFSTFLSGPVAMITTLSALVLGFFGSTTNLYFEARINSGGGPIESFIRIITQKGSMIDLDTGNSTLEQVIQGIDYGLMYAVELLKGAVPNFSHLGTGDFIAYGVDLFNGLLARHIVITIGYFLMTAIVGYFFLKTREIAA